MPTVKSASSEAQEQRIFFEWLARWRPFARALTFAIPNGGSRNIVEAKNLKLEGVTAGVPDVFMAIPNGTFSGLFIEFKYGKNKTTDLQNAFIARLREEGYCVHVCYSFEDAQSLVIDYLLNTNYR